MSTSRDKSDKKSNPDLDPELVSLLKQDREQTLIKTISQILESKKEMFTLGLTSILKGQAISVSGDESVAAANSGEWIAIESLSRLRGVVGGRFQNLKKRWVDAGFPLREHRGDRWKDFSVDQDGWMELVTWVAKQGFEARLTPDSNHSLFELRQLNSKSSS